MEFRLPPAGSGGMQEAVTLSLELSTCSVRELSADYQQRNENG